MEPHDFEFTSVKMLPINTKLSFSNMRLELAKYLDREFSNDVDILDALVTNLLISTVACEELDKQLSEANARIKRLELAKSRRRTRKTRK